MRGRKVLRNDTCDYSGYSDGLGTVCTWDCYGWDIQVFDENRIHVAAKCDTMGALLVLSGLIVLSGWTVFSLKLALVIVFLWLCNPAASHLVARAEVKTNPELERICDFVDLTEGDESDDNR